MIQEIHFFQNDPSPNENAYNGVAQLLSRLVVAQAVHRLQPNMWKN